MLKYTCMLPGTSFLLLGQPLWITSRRGMKVGSLSEACLICCISAYFSASDRVWSTSAKLRDRSQTCSMSSAECIR